MKTYETTNNHAQSSAAIDAIHHELTQLQEQYGQQLQNEHVASEILCLRSWIEDFKGGSMAAAHCLQQHGEELLKDVKSRLELANTEAMRMDDESPNPAPSDRKLNKLNKALKLATKTEANLNTALGNEVKH